SGPAGPTRRTSAGTPQAGVVPRQRVSAKAAESRAKRRAERRAARRARPYGPARSHVTAARDTGGSGPATSPAGPGPPEVPPAGPPPAPPAPPGDGRRPG